MNFLNKIEPRSLHNVDPGGSAARVDGLAAWRVSLAFQADPIKCLETYTARHGEMVRVERRLPGRKGPIVLTLIGPAHNREVLMAGDRLRPTGIWPLRGPAGSAQSNLRDIFLMKQGAEHTTFSRATSPFLDRRAVQQHFEAVKRIAALEIADWPVDGVADVYAFARVLAQRYAFALIFGEPDRAHNRRFGAMLVSYHAANWSRLAAWAPLDLPGTPYRRLLREAEALQTFIIQWSAAAKQCPHHQQTANLRTAIAALPGTTLERTAANLAGYALASYETTATTLTWVLVLLASHPRAAAALLGELEAAGPVADLDFETLNGLPVLDGVMRETMRVVAPVPFLGFRTFRDCEVSKQDLPRGALVIISPHMTHRLSRLYAEPRRFLPERWQSLRPNAYEYLPFSGGQRRCPGYLFAENNLKVALATILPKLKLSLPQGGLANRAHAAITVPTGTMPMRFERQDGRFRASAPRGSFFDLLDVA